MKLKESLAAMIRANPVQPTPGLLTDTDVYLFNEGSHFSLADRLGAHPLPEKGGTYFAVWAPNAEQVSVIGEFNGWDKSAHYLHARDNSGIWEGFIPGVKKGQIYKYHIQSRYWGYQVDKADPLALYAEKAPCTASIVWDLEYQWNDQAWMAGRGRANGPRSAISIYEVHLGSWQRIPEDNHRSLSYREIAAPLAEHVKKMGFTHVEFLPIMEHPFYGSWGYQVTGFFAPTSRYGTPQDFMYLVDYLHHNGIGVILDWVPSHFPMDEHGLAYFDGSHLYEHADERQGFHPDWKSAIFNYGRNEVRSFLISSARFWLDKYHVDGLRVDAVASMLYLDYSRKEGEWIPNEYGGRENLSALSFLRRLNEEAYRAHPDVIMIAEESTAWPMVSRPTYLGGLGFGYKWDMGWMHDTLKYLTHDPIHRKFHHNQLTFRMLYAFTENFVLSLSHDEVVHGKGSLLSKMPGDPWQQFANLRLLFGYQFAQPGKKLLFMGGEFGQGKEWNHDHSLDWHQLELPCHAGIARWVADLNRFYSTEPAMCELETDWEGFNWIDPNDGDNSVLSFARFCGKREHPVLVVCNFTPVVREDYHIGVPKAGFWRAMLNSDDAVYGGSGVHNGDGLAAEPVPCHNQPCMVKLKLPPLSIQFFRCEE
jgi:1,4-alpha-glucan branching enzyme